MYSQAFQSFRVRAKQNINLLQRLDASKRFQRRVYASSARNTNENSNIQKTLPESFPSVDNRSLVIFAIPAALLGFVGLAAYARYNDEKRSIKKGGGSKGGIAVKGPTIGGQFTLVNTERQIVTERDFLGHWVLLYFGYTSSPDVGPAEVQKMAKAIDILESKDVKLLPVFVTLDPQRDPPSQLKAYLREFDPRIVGLTGSVNATRQMAQEYRIFFKKVEEDGNDYLVETSHNMYLMNPNMEIMRCFGLEYDATQLAESIMKELKRNTS